MKAILGQNIVNASGGANVLGEVLSGLTNSWSKSNDINQRVEAQKGLADYKHNLALERDVHKMAINTTAKLAANEHNYQLKSTFENLQSNNRKSLTSLEEDEKRKSTTHKADVDLYHMKEMTKGQMIAAGETPIEGAIGSNMLGGGKAAAHPTGLSFSPEGLKAARARANGGHQAGQQQQQQKARFVGSDGGIVDQQGPTIKVPAAQTVASKLGTNNYNG